MTGTLKQALTLTAATLLAAAARSGKPLGADRRRATRSFQRFVRRKPARGPSESRRDTLQYDLAPDAPRGVERQRSAEVAASIIRRLAEREVVGPKILEVPYSTVVSGSEVPAWRPVLAAAPPRVVLPATVATPAMDLRPPTAPALPTTNALHPNPLPTPHESIPGGTHLSRGRSSVELAPDLLGPPPGGVGKEGKVRVGFPGLAGRWKRGRLTDMRHVRFKVSGGVPDTRWVPSGGCHNAENSVTCCCDRSSGVNRASAESRGFP